MGKGVVMRLVETDLSDCYQLLYARNSDTRTNHSLPVNFMAMTKSKFEEAIINRAGIFIAHLLKVYLMGNNTGNFDHWCHELYTFYEPFSGIVKKGDKKSTYSNKDVMAAYKQWYDIGEESSSIPQIFLGKLSSINRKYNIKGKLTNKDLAILENLLIELLNKTCSSEWEEKNIIEMLEAFK